MSAPTCRVVVFIICLLVCCDLQAEPRLPGTAPWTLPGRTADELAADMVAGIDRFLLEETEAAGEKRAAFWNPDFSTPEAYETSIEPQRERLRWILGLRDQRVSFASPTMTATLDKPAQIGTIAQDDKMTHKILNVSWPVVGNIVWEGLLIEPAAPATCTIILLPDAGQSPVDLLAIDFEGQIGKEWPFESIPAGCRVIIPAVISRAVHPFRRVELTDREFIYRTSFEMGRTPIGYEIQAVLGIVDWLKKSTPATPIGIAGQGDGGRIALFAAALDARIDAAVVNDYFGPRQNLWTEPIDRNLFGYLEQFGDAETAALIFPRPLVVQNYESTERAIATKGGGPGTLKGADYAAVVAEAERARKLVNSAAFGNNWLTTFELTGPTELLLMNAAARLATTLSLSGQEQAAEESAIASVGPMIVVTSNDPLRPHTESQARLVKQITAHNMQLLAESAEVRKEFFQDLDVSSPDKFEATVEPYREYFRTRVIGEFDQPLLEPQPRSRVWRETEHWTGFQVALDVFPDVFAYGILLVPHNIPPGERRPVVVCQHGLEGIPEDTIENDHSAYHDFAARLADKGYVVFAPQNPYRGQDAFRTLQRKANPLGKSLFSIIVPQHEQITRWLGSLPFVDKDRIAFYGLSYGGKTAMRVPPLVTNYCLSICSADFNDWIAKNVSVTAPFSYVGTGEYEIYEFDLGNTFNYAEMARLIAPRPFMVERGHFDGVGPDDWVGAEFAKIRRFYHVDLKLPPGRAEIEWFVGPHTINAVGTFDFLDRHLGKPE